MVRPLIATVCATVSGGKCGAWIPGRLIPELLRCLGPFRCQACHVQTRVRTNRPFNCNVVEALLGLHSCMFENGQTVQNWTRIERRVRNMPLTRIPKAESII